MVSLLPILFTLLAASHPARASACPNCQFIAERDLIAYPESERGIRSVLIGLEPRQQNLALATSVAAPGLPDNQVRRIEEKFYWMDLDQVHGGLLRSLPADTRLLVGVPDRRLVAGCLGTEKTLFRDYLRKRLKWPAERVRRDVMFFDTPASLEWSQDFTFCPGLDSRGRQWIAQGSEGDVAGYRRAVRALAAALPDRFRLWPLPAGVSAEGGDMCLATLPDGKPGLLIGRHRVTEYLRRTGQGFRNELGPDPSQIEEARAAYSRAYAGLPVVIVPEKALGRLDEVGEDVFHLDMIVTAAWVGGKAWAFVPEYAKGAVDANSRRPLRDDMVEKAALEFDLAADQLKGLGFRVGRLPLSDHMVRSPANALRFTTDDGQPAMMLPRFPHHLPAGDPNAPQNTLQAMQATCNDLLRRWQAERSPECLRRLDQALDATLARMEASASLPAPLYDAQAKVLADAGVEVIPVPSFVWGAGSLHCHTFH